MKVSVLIPVKNGQKFLLECLKSIESQSFSDFEVVFIDDHSTDQTYIQLIDLLKGKDNMNVFHNPSVGLVEALNYGILLSRGDYIARMDIDDIMLPYRLERQVQILDRHPTVAVCASSFELFGGDKGVHRYSECLLKSTDVLPLLLKDNFIAHPTVMLRKSFLQDHTLKYKNYLYAEDYKLWVDIACNDGDIYLIPEVLMKYRISTSQVSYKFAGTQVATASVIQEELLNYLIDNNFFQYPRLIRVLSAIIEELNQLNLLSDKEILSLFSRILHNQNKRHDESSHTQ